jgi:Leucine-rich repeat (LRR) protein
LAPLASLTSLRELYLDNCLGRFSPLESLLPTLKELALYRCKLDDLPPEACGGNALDIVRAHYEDLKFGQLHDAMNHKSVHNM